MLCAFIRLQCTETVKYKQNCTVSYMAQTGYTLYRGQLKEDLQPFCGPRVFGCARWRKGRVKIPSELTQDKLNSIDDARVKTTTSTIWN